MDAGTFFQRTYAFFSNRSIVVSAFTVSMALSLVLARNDILVSGEGGRGVVYLQLAFTSGNFFDVLSGWGDSGIDFFLRTIWLDFIYPPAYAVLFSSAGAYFSFKTGGFSAGRIPAFNTAAFILPFITALFDYAENVAEIVILSRRICDAPVIFSASVLSAIKWLLALISLVLLIKIYFSMRRGMSR